ncbi:integrase core domain-containing protein [Streptomyces sp. NPDC001307]|uniref:integrase core domain-containing protein n=1 Tax=Streptomyces sp. NPDC001307 TaxID=3364560 RepID=UPI00368FBED7
MEAVREATARAPGADRCEGHRAARLDAPRPTWRPQQVLPVHRDRRLHPPARPTDLPDAEPGHRHPVPRLRAAAPAVSGRGHPDRQRRRVPIRLPLARARQGHRAHVHQAPHTAAEREVERSHRIDADEFYRLLDGVIIDDAEVFNDKLREWEDYYNCHRPHGGLGGQTPHERLKQKTTAQA